MDRSVLLSSTRRRRKEADEASALAIDSNGKIVIGGAGGANGDVIAARYNTDGSLDTGCSGDDFAVARSRRP